MTPRAHRLTSVLTWPLRIVWSLLWYLKEFVVANLRVTREVVTPGHQSTPIVVRFHTRCHTEPEVSLLSLLISITPGTLLLATEETTGQNTEWLSGRPVHERRPGMRTFDLFVHSMFDDDPEHLITTLYELEEHALSAARPSLPHKVIE